MRRTASLALLVLLVSGCGRQPLDLLVPSHAEDSCLAFVTEADCASHASLGCSFQPNLEGCKRDDPSCAPGTCRSGDPFVRRVERSFLLNGAPFRFAGVSSWAMLQPEGCAAVDPSEKERWVEAAYDDLVPARAKVARFFAFQNSAGPSGTDFTLMDLAVRAARRAGVRLQLALDADDGNCSSGLKHDAAWYGGGYQAPEGTYALSYRDYAEALARHYRDEPTVLGYVLMQGMHSADPTTLSAFVTEMGQRLHGLASNQLISIDLEWGGDAARYVELQELPVVDFMDVDDYTFKYPAAPMSSGLLAALAEVPKPAVIGEGAFQLQGGKDADALQARADVAAERMEQWQGWGFAGALLWAYDPGWTEVSEEFDGRPEDPMLQPDGVLANAPW